MKPSVLRVKPDLPRRVPCKIAFIGEAPGEIEEQTGRVLTGPSGKTFNQMLRSADLNRADYLVTNVFDIKAGDDNDVKIWTKSRKEAEALGWNLDAFPQYEERFFDPEFLGPQLARLGAEIEAAKPTVLVPLGGTALWALTGLTQITAARGAVTKARLVAPGMKIVPALHPAFVMRQWKMFHVTVGDFLKAAAEAELGPAVNYANRFIWIEPSLGDLRHFKKEFLDKSSLISVDIETSPKFRQITCIGFAADAQHCIVVPFVDWRKPSRSYWPTVQDELAAMAFCETVLDMPAPKLLQNGPYDVFWLYNNWGMKVRNYSEDTRLLHHSLYPEMPKDLGFMGACYAQQGPWKLMRGDKGGKKDE